MKNLQNPFQKIKERKCPQCGVPLMVDLQVAVRNVEIKVDMSQLDKVVRKKLFQR